MCLFNVRYYFVGCFLEVANFGAHATLVRDSTTVLFGIVGLFNSLYRVHTQLINECQGT